MKLQVQHIVNVSGGKVEPERWKPAEGFNGFYEVSDRGRLRSVSRITCDGKNLKGRVLKTHRRRGKYVTAHLSVNGKVTSVSVHVLVARAFVDGWFPGAEVNHGDGKKHRNIWTNLEWTTRSENNKHRYRVLGHPPVRACTGRFGRKHPLSKPVVGISILGGSTLRFESARLSSRKGFHQGAVSKCARGEQASHKGYVWKYDTTSGCHSSYGLCE